MLLVTISVRSPTGRHSFVIEAKDETDFMRKILSLQRRMARQGLAWHCHRINTAFWPRDPGNDLTPIVAVMPQ